MQAKWNDWSIVFATPCRRRRDIARRMTPPRILSIAGSDSSGGAGIQADIKTIAMLDGYAMTAITAITAQNTLGVQSAVTLSPDMVAAQIDACAFDIGIDAIKIGMIGSSEIADIVATRLDTLDCPVIFDPVMVATSGAVLADSDMLGAFRRLMDRATVITPNLPELEALTDTTCDDSEAIVAAALALAQRHRTPVLAKGGHDENDPGRVTDRLVWPDGAVWSANLPWIDTRHTHGTGCTLSSAIATGVGRGLPLKEAVETARQFVRLAIKDAPGFGAKAGPLGHQKVRLDFPSGPTLNQITLPARDYAEAVEFYTRFGLTHIVDSPDNGYARFECVGGATVSVSTDHGTAGDASLYFETGELAKIHADLSDKGIALGPIQSQNWNWREAWGSDPSGNRFCIYEAREDRRHPPWRIERQS